MIRILRLDKKVLSPKAQSYVAHAQLWREEVHKALGQEIGSLMPLVDVDPEYVSFLTPLEGSISEVRQEQLSPQLFELCEGRRKALLFFLNGQQKLQNPELEAERSEVAMLFARSSRLYLMDGINPVLLPCLTEEELKSAAPPPQSVKKSGCLLPLLLPLLLLLALLGLVWYFLLRPWPMEGTLQERFEDLYKTYFREDTSAQEAELEKIRSLALSLIARQEAEKARLEEERLAQEQAKKDEDARKLEEALKAQEEAEKAKQEAEQARLDAEKARLEALEGQKKAQEEALKLKGEQQKLLEQQKQQQSVKSAPAAKSDGGKSLPKCTTLKQQGKLPKMVVAFDGSESMLARDVSTFGGRASRLDVATQAANNMVKTIDKNVQIGLVEINGCSTAKNRGFFSGTQRSQLMGTIKGINPRRYDGKTPLVDGLNKLASMVDGVNAEAVGVLISDGEDTCTFTQNIDICSLARKIHAQKPKLKIHTILIGRNASKAACVARITGGRVFSPQNASQINAQLQEAGAEFKQVCKDD
ncbi:MAG: VWA domain-containing protein [Succinivibrio sp.]|nr:VWA domain-containing protein [Succinivibrio sp.]